MEAPMHFIPAHTPASIGPTLLTPMTGI